MKKTAKLPTILGLIVLVFGVVAGIFLINSRQEFSLDANAESAPKNVRVSNITDNSVSVTWTTDIESSGFIKWGTSPNSLNKVSLEEGSEKNRVHMVNILGIEPNTTIYFKINSDTKDHDNEGLAWKTQTVVDKTSMPNTLLASGTVLLADGNTPAKAIVSLSINGKIISGITSNEGTFVIPVSNYVESIPETSIIEITVNAGITGTAQATIYPKNIKSIPTMIIGKTYDFRTLSDENINSLPESTISIPESVEISSRFVIERNEKSQTTTTNVTLDSIKDNEIITTTDPEFFGEGPVNTTIEISVESELQEAAITTSSKGAWKWSPPNNLEPGEHKVTLKWKDASGIARTLTRTFVVSAAEGPAFESTPSATPEVEATTTPTSTSKASSTPKVSSAPTMTAPPTPETGSLTPTLGLFIMGIGVLMSSIFVYKKSNA